MPLPIIVVPPFPNVPFAEGVPAVLRGVVNGLASAANQAVAALLSDAASVFGFGVLSTWGIADSSGNLVLTADSVFALEFEKDFRVSDYPQQRGAFASYNKVETPSVVKVTFSQAGTAADRQAFLDAVAFYVSDTTNLYEVFTPEVTYSSVTLDHYDYRRTSQNGATLLQVTIHCTQVRVTATTSFSTAANPAGVGTPGTTATPSGANVVSTGPVQPSPLPDSFTGEFF